MKYGLLQWGAVRGEILQGYLDFLLENLDKWWNCLPRKELQKAEQEGRRAGVGVKKRKMHEIQF